jgi:hypothetical protein
VIETESKLAKLPMIYSFLRLIFPSWRFFDRLGVRPRLEVRTRGPHGRWSDWREALQSPGRLKWWNLFLNPEGGLYHARCNLIEGFVQEIGLEETSRRIAELDSYRRLSEIARESVGSGQAFQFRLVVNEHDEVLLLAPEEGPPETDSSEAES